MGFKINSTIYLGHMSAGLLVHVLLVFSFADLCFDWSFMCKPRGARLLSYLATAYTLQLSVCSSSGSLFRQHGGSPDGGSVCLLRGVIQKILRYTPSASSELCTGIIKDIICHYTKRRLRVQRVITSVQITEI